MFGLLSAVLRPAGGMMSDLTCRITGIFVGEKGSKARVRPRYGRVHACSWFC